MNTYKFSTSFFIATLLILVSSCAENNNVAEVEQQKEKVMTVVIIKTSLGDINLELNNEKAPITNCREAGIIGPVTGLIGSMQVNEAIKEIALKDYQSTAGNLFIYDGLDLNLEKIKLVKNVQCPICSN